MLGAEPPADLGPTPDSVHGRAPRRELRVPADPVPPEDDVSATDVLIPGPDGQNLGVRLYRPVGSASAGLPALLWAHGGGWVFFDEAGCDASCRGLARRTGALVVAPKYRLAPEHCFPAAHDDVGACWRWLKREAGQLGVDGARLALGGESVGATMAVATCLADDGPAGDGTIGLAARALVLVSPLTTTDQVGDSIADAANAAPLSRPLLTWMLTHAFRDRPGMLVDPRVNPLSLAPQRLGALPATILITADRDPLHSQGLAFAELLRTAGTSSVVVRFDGMPHGFFGTEAVVAEASRAQDGPYPLNLDTGCVTQRTAT